MSGSVLPVLAFAVLLTALGGADLRAEDWTTLDGKIYAQVAVVKIEPDAVTITYREGGALIPLANLPPDLQQRFHYDPAKAKAAADARAGAAGQDAKALAAEKAQADKLAAAREAKFKADQAAAKAAAQAQAQPATPDVLSSNQFQVKPPDPLPTGQFDLHQP